MWDHLSTSLSLQLGCLQPSVGCWVHLEPQVHGHLQVGATGEQTVEEIELMLMVSSVSHPDLARNWIPQQDHGSKQLRGMESKQDCLFQSNNIITITWLRQGRAEERVQTYAI